MAIRLEQLKLETSLEPMNVALHTSGGKIQVLGGEAGDALKVIDGSLATRFSPQTSVDKYAVIELTPARALIQAVKVNELKIYLYADPDHPRQYTYWVEGAPYFGKYETIVSEKTQEVITNVACYTEKFKATRLKHLKLHLKSSLNAPEICEWEVYATPDEKKRYPNYHLEMASNIKEARKRVTEKYIQYLRRKEFKLPKKRIGKNFPENLTEWLEYATYLRQKLMEVLQFPLERCPLNAKVVGQENFDDYVIEKVIYASEKNSLVTANVYVPKNVTFPAPVIILASGHNLSKDNFVNQYGGQIYVKGGCICLIPDTIGEGDRRFSGEHSSSHSGFVDSGLNAGRQIVGKMVWDLVRGIDYLYTRPDVDIQRIACTGHSLGGDLSALLAAVDTRLTLSIPTADWMTSRYTSGRSGSCVALYNLQRNLTPVEMVALVAPRPQLMIYGEKDFIPLEDGIEAYKRARRIYKLLGAGDKVDIHIVKGVGHGPFHLTRAAYAWIGKHFGMPKFTLTEIEKLKETTNPHWEYYQDTTVVDLPVKVLPSSLDEEGLDNTTHCERLDCLKGLEYMDDQYSIWGWTNNMIKKATPKFDIPKTLGEWEAYRASLVERLRNVLAPSKRLRLGRPKTLRSFKALNGCTVEEVIFGELGLSSYLIMPNGPFTSQRAVIYLNETRTKEGALTSKAVQWLMSEKIPVLALDLVATSYSNDIDTLIGMSATGVNINHVLESVEYLLRRPDIDAKNLTCIGEVDDVALYAAILEERIHEVFLIGEGGRERLETWPVEWANERWEGVVPNICSVGERQALLAAVAPRLLHLMFEEDIDKVEYIYALYSAHRNLIFPKAK